jgi:hypothetical protein
MPKGWVLYWTVVVVGTILLVVVLAPPGMLEAIGKLIGAVAPIVTVGLAIFGVFVWRLQLVAKRRFELAEAGLSATIAVIMALDAVRDPLRFGSEGEGRTPDPNEGADDKRRLDNLYVSLARMGHFKEEFTSLEKQAMILEAHFGREVTRHMWDILRVRNKIRAAVMTLRDLRPDFLEGENLRVYRMLHRVLAGNSENPANDDEVSFEIRASKEKLFAALRPYLEEPRFWDVFRIGPRPSPQEQSPA